MSRAVCAAPARYYDGGGNDQGLSFYLPNGTWLQPPGYVHKMVHDTWLPGALKVSILGSDSLSVSAQIAKDRSSLRLLVVNNQTVAAEVSVAIKNWAAGGHANVTTLSAASLTADNPPHAAGLPGLVAPTNTIKPWGPGAHNFPPQSVSVVVLQRGSR